MVQIQNVKHKKKKAVIMETEIIPEGNIGETFTKKQHYQDSSDEDDQKKSHSIHIIMRPTGPEEVVKITDTERKATKKRLFQEFKDLPEEEDEFGEISEAA
jgi:hypothetical protein